MGFGLPVLALGLLGAAVAAFLYVPLIGKQLAVGLIAMSAATFAYDLGFERRAALDNSAALETTIAGLRSDVAEMKRQAVAAQAVAADAREAERNAEDQAAINQGKVDEYVAYLAKHPSGDCGLTDADIGRLRGIGAAHGRVRAKPPARTVDLRPAGPASESP